MKAYSILLLAILISGCVIVEEPKEYTFEEAFDEMLNIDEKYGADFYTEALDVENRFSDGWLYEYDWNRTIVSLENIGPMKEEILKLKGTVSRVQTEDTEIILRMMELRAGMLEVQKMYQEGLVLEKEIKGELLCSVVKEEKEFAMLFNESTILGQEITGEWDDMLTDIPKTRAVLSEEKRPKFYDSPYWPIRKEAIARISKVEDC